MAWQGRRLTGATNGTNTISYSYDENGIRTQKTVNGTVTNYNYHGSALISQVTDNDTLLFSYDTAGNAAAVNYNGTYYYYVRNGQNDIIRLIDGDNNTVVEYAYDSWGTPLSTTGTLASTLGAQNPFRYRGYVYDEETCWYYLQSRYYDPNVCRFLSADVMLSTGQGVLGHDTYAYCLNNPVSMLDDGGEDAVLLVDEEGLGHIGIMIEDSDGNWWHFYWGSKPGLSYIACVIGVDVEPKTWCLKYTGEVDLEKINSENQYSGDYTDMFYLKGDFSSSIDMAKNPVGMYNLYSNSCVHMSLKVLYASESKYQNILGEMIKYTNSGLLNKMPKQAFKYFKDNSSNQVFIINRKYDISRGIRSALEY